MKIRLGLGLDGYQSASVGAELDSITCGPLGLLGVLETRLGLKGKGTSEVRRILEFKTALEEHAAKGAAFYARSFEKDPLAVSSTLLRWRDRLVEAGWNGLAAKDDSSRLRDMAALETAAAGRLSSGVADRLATVLRTLDERSAEIESLTVLEVSNHLPALWVRVCGKLRAEYRSPNIEFKSAKAAPGTDLAAVQDLLANPKVAKKLRLRGDGSLVCYTAHSELTLAKAMAQALSHAQKGGSTTLVAGDGAGVLESALMDLDESALGLVPRSRARPIPQVLLLALRLRWEPLDPRALLEFLTHPVCPVIGLLRKPLADAVAASPGIGGPKWNEAVESARADAGAILDPSAQAEALRRIDEDLDRWLLCARHDPSRGALGKSLSECCAKVARWAGARSAASTLQDCEQEQFLTLASAASALADLLGAFPLVTRAQLDSLTREVISSGWPGRFVPAELGQMHRVADPAALIESADTVAWWDFRAPGPFPRLPWSEAELKQLEAHGCQFLSPETMAAQASAARLRPLFAAHKRLIFAFPRQVAGEPVARQPLHSRLLALLETPSTGLPTHDFDTELCCRSSAPPIRFITQKHVPLPQPRRWWKLSSGRLLAARDRESYSSLEKLIYSPYAWVLRYHARIQPGPVPSMRPQSDSALKGTLLHRLLDLVLAAPASELDWRRATRPQLNAWLEKQWQGLLQQEGAIFLLPGRVADGVALLDAGQNALWELLEQLRRARVTEARSNVAPGAAPFFGGELEGFIDLVVETQSARVGVIDLKLGGREVREKELAENRPLQLAVYGYLLGGKQGNWPEAAFFILGPRRLLAQSNGYFPGAWLSAPTATAFGLANCWEDAERVWRWRRKQLDAGWVEVTADGTTPEDSPPEVLDPAPLAYWQATEAHAKYNDYDALTGWRADA